MEAGKGGLMGIKLMGAVLIIAGCGGYGWMMANNHRREVEALRRLVSALEYMAAELEYKLTPLPVLCTDMESVVDGCMGQVFARLGRLLNVQIYPNVQEAMAAAVRETKGLPPMAAKQLLSLGKTLGKFDLSGQLRGLNGCRLDCCHQLEELEHNQSQRLRSYQTLGFCAGVALAILLI